MKKLIGITLLTLAFGSNALAMTDYGCVNRCTQQGNQYGLCVARCSY